MLPRTADVVVVGGGLVGCATARALARRGTRVVVLERGRVGDEASGAAAGMVAPQAECEGPGPLLAAGVASRRRYGAFVAAIESETGVDVAYRRDGIVYVALDRMAAARLARRVRWQRALGLRAVRLTVADAVRRMRLLTDAVRAAALFPDDHRVDNERLTAAVAAAARRAGARILESTPALAVEAVRGRVARVRTARGTIAAAVVVDAAGAWAADVGLPGRVARPPVAPVRGQMLVLRAEPGALPSPLYSARAYLVPRVDGRILVGSTLEHVGFEKRVTVHAVTRLLRAATAMIPSLAGATVERAYAGLRPGTPDHLPIVGPARDLPGLVYAAGLYRSGILLAPLVADAVAELVERGSMRASLAAFRPDRFPAPGTKTRAASKS